MTTPEAYSKAEAIDAAIEEDLAEYLERFKEPSNLMSDKLKVKNCLTYLRTIRTTLDICEQILKQKIE